MVEHRGREDRVAAYPLPLRTLAALLALGLLTASCALAAQDAVTASGGAAPTAEPIAPEAVNDACLRAATSGCRVFEGSQREYRYLVLDEAGALSDVRDVVVLDLGGPGEVLFPSNTMELERQVRSTLGPLVDGRRVLLLEEPWVGRTVPESCAGALTEFVSQLRTDLTTSGDATVLDECTLPIEDAGWTAERYREALGGALAHEEARMVGFVGLSFGAVRSTYLREDTDVWKVLVRPAAAPGSDAADVLAARTRSIERALREACTPCGASGSLDAYLTEVVRDLDARPLTVEQRSVPVTGFDYLSALVVSGLQSEPEQLSELLEEPRAHAGTVGQLSDALWSRYGTDAIGPGYLAYLNEVCPAYQAWAGPGSTTLIDALVHAAHAPCSQNQVDHLVPSAAADCVVTAEEDVVAPPELARTWKITNNATVSSKIADHWLDGASACASLEGREW